MNKDKIYKLVRNQCMDKFGEIMDNADLEIYKIIGEKGERINRGMSNIGNILRDKAREITSEVKKDIKDYRK